MEILEKHSGRSFDALYTPITLNQVTANRIVSTPYSELYAEAGMPTERYIRYHEEKAEGGIGLTMGGASSVSLDSPQLWGPSIDVTRDAMIPHFQNLDSAVHRHGTAIMIQLTHLGRRSRSDRGFWPHLVSPSGVRGVVNKRPGQSHRDSRHQNASSTTSRWLPSVSKRAVSTVQKSQRRISI